MKTADTIFKKRIGYRDWIKFSELHFKSHGICPRCGLSFGPPGTPHICKSLVFLIYEVTRS